jgi:hypothetical protein
MTSRSAKYRVLSRSGRGGIPESSAPIRAAQTCARGSAPQTSKRDDWYPWWYTGPRTVRNVNQGGRRVLVTPMFRELIPRTV